MSEATKNKKRSKQTAELKICSYDVATIEETVKQIIKYLTDYKLNFSGPVPLKTKVKVVTVLTSPHKHKDAQEQFSRSLHRRVIFLKDKLNRMDVNNLSKINIPNTAQLTFKVKEIS